MSDQGAAWKFVSWATSKQYDSLVASKYGWSAVPPGTRTSLYSNPSYQKAATAFADITMQSIDGTDPDHPTVNPVPYVGVQYVDIPQFESLGLQVGQQIAGAIAGTESVTQALRSPVRRLGLHAVRTVRPTDAGQSATWPFSRTSPRPPRPGSGRGGQPAREWQRRLPLLPALIYIIVVTQVPFLVTLCYSFQNYFWNEPGGAHWTGVSNYKEVFTDPNFRSALWRSVTMTAIAVIFAMALGIALAVLLDKKFIGRGVVRTLIITPFLVMPAAAALIWAGPMLDPNFGLLNYLLEPFGVNHVAWLTTHAYGSVIVVMIWQWTPFMTLIVLAGLQGQAQDALEAARVDGANAWAIFRELTLPHLRPYIELGILLGSIYLVNAFDQVRLMTNGGPGTSTTTLPFYIYQKVNYAFDIGGSAAAGVVTVVLTIIVASFALRLFARVFQFEEAR